MRGLRDLLPPAGGATGTERQFQALVENIPGIVAYRDLVQPDDPAHSIPLYISPQIEDMLGYPRDAWLPDDNLWLQDIHPDDAERMGRADAKPRSQLPSLLAQSGEAGPEAR